MINAEFLASCSEEQINKGVAWCQVAFSVDKAMASENVELYRYGMNYDMSVPRHYCTNANDIMPIAFANNFLIEPPNFFTNKWSATKYYIVENIGERSVKATNTNPMRAICEVYILMSVNK